jgi:hypothetical protein
VSRQDLPFIQLLPISSFGPQMKFADTERILPLSCDLASSGLSFYTAIWHQIGGNSNSGFSFFSRCELSQTCIEPVRFRKSRGGIRISAVTQYISARSQVTEPHTGHRRQVAGKLYILGCPLSQPMHRARCQCIHWNRHLGLRV